MKIGSVITVHNDNNVDSRSFSCGTPKGSDQFFLEPIGFYEMVKFYESNYGYVLIKCPLCFGEVSCKKCNFKLMVYKQKAYCPKCEG